VRLQSRRFRGHEKRWLCHRTPKSGRDQRFRAGKKHLRHRLRPGRPPAKTIGWREIVFGAVTVALAALGYA